MKVYVRNPGGTYILVDVALLPLPPTRELLTANRTYYVRPDGSDVDNDGLSDAAGGAFATWQKGIDTLLTLDGGGFAATLKAGGTGARTWNAGIIVPSPFLGFSSVTLEGDTGTPANVLLSTTSSDCIRVAGKATLSVKGFKLQTTTSGACLNAIEGGTILVPGAMNYGACAFFHTIAQGPGSAIKISADYTISGGAAIHWGAIDNANLTVYPNGLTITLTGTPAFSSDFAYASRVAGVTVWGHTFSGGATGRRFLADSLAMIFVNGAGLNYLPGDAAGVESLGGRYG